MRRNVGAEVTLCCDRVMSFNLGAVCTTIWFFLFLAHVHTKPNCKVANNEVARRVGKCASVHLFESSLSTSNKRCVIIIHRSHAASNSDSAWQASAS